MNILEHPILGKSINEDFVNVTVDGVPMRVKTGSMIAAALLAEGIRVNRYTRKRHEPRGIFCGIGQCTDCVMVVNGLPNVRTCITKVEEGMTIETQNLKEGRK
jgi:predicted molibdopterin-dependent oxidoreductase YjgC